MENLKVIITLANNKKYTLEEFLKKKITFSIADPVNAEVVRNFNAGVRTEEKNNKNAKAREIEIKKEYRKGFTFLARLEIIKGSRSK